MTIYGMSEQEWLEFEPETIEIEDIELLEEMNANYDLVHGSW